MLSLLLLVSLYFFANSKSLPAVISEINVPCYLGHWKQVYQAPTNVIFQGYGTCITADYGLLDNGNITVLNAQLDENHSIEQISGYAYYKNASEPGKLTVHLDGVPVDSPYWIVKLGEVVDNQYQYSIITIPSGISLWVLVRDIDVFMKYYNTEVEDFLQQYEFKYTVVTCNSPTMLNKCSNAS
jgi:lipocalin